MWSLALFLCSLSFIFMVMNWINNLSDKPQTQYPIHENDTRPEPPRGTPAMNHLLGVPGIENRRRMIAVEREQAAQRRMEILRGAPMRVRQAYRRDDFLELLVREWKYADIKEETVNWKEEGF